MKKNAKKSRPIPECHQEHFHEECCHQEAMTPAAWGVLGAGIVLFLTAYIGTFPKAVSTLLFLAAYLLVSYDILWESVEHIRNGQIFDENFLMSIATIGALIIREYPEAIAVMLFYKTGEYFQHKAVARSRASIRDLMDMNPDHANLMEGMAAIRVVAPGELTPGDTILIRPGEKIPADAVIIEGESQLNTAALTGESRPQTVRAGDKILSGSMNLSGRIIARVEKSSEESTASRILKLIEEASEKKAPTEKFITRFSRVYTPIVVFAAVLLAIIPPLIRGGFTEWFYRAISFLVISCPCALVISVPLGFFGGIGLASRNGILVKGSNYLELLSRLDIIAFDKTGTLTRGNFALRQLIPAEGISSETLLQTAAYGELNSTHPIALSVLQANQLPLEPDYILSVEEISGQGIAASTPEGVIYVGSDKLMREKGINFIPNHSPYTVVYVAFQKDFYGTIVIADELKEGAKEGLARISKVGISRMILLTGDRQACADGIAGELAIPEAYGGLLPDEKLAYMEKLYQQEPHCRIAFVGDGINDAPILARADVGIAMGGMGSDAAIEAADIVLMTDEPGKIATAIHIAKRTKKVITENIVFALGVKLLVLLLVTLGFANMWMAVFADVGVALLAVLNALRLAFVNVPDTDGTADKGIQE